MLDRVRLVGPVMIAASPGVNPVELVLRKPGSKSVVLIVPLPIATTFGPSCRSVTTKEESCAGSVLVPPRSWVATAEADTLQATVVKAAARLASKNNLSRVMRVPS